MAVPSFSQRKLSAAQRAAALVMICIISLLRSAIAQTAATLTTNAPAVSVTLAQAEQRARQVEPTLAAALAARGTAELNRSIARSAILPQGSILGQYLFTQSNGKLFGGVEANTPGPVFIANNAVHEYVTQFQATETLGLSGIARYRQTGALLLQAQAQAEIAARGLHVAVTQAYYTVEADAQKQQAAEQAQTAAEDFLALSRKLEDGREVAHADVLKAQLQLEAAQRAAADAALVTQAARESLALFLFPNPATPYTLTDPLDRNPDGSAIAVPAEADIRALAAYGSPELAGALAAVAAANADLAATRDAYLPSFSLAYNYGLDAPEIARFGSLGQRFLGYSASAGVTIPVWDWLATRDRIRQSEFLHRQAKAALTYAQRQQIAALDIAYAELKISADNLASLNQSAAQSKESLRLTELQYQAGLAIALEVVNAENTAVAAESAAADGALRYQVARANLERITGRLP